MIGFTNAKVIKFFESNKQKGNNMFRFFSFLNLFLTYFYDETIRNVWATYLWRDFDVFFVHLHRQLIIEEI